MKKVLVLGATGFIGGHIAKAALEQNWEVAGLRRTPGKTGHLDGLPIQWFDGKMSDEDSLRKAMQGRDSVFHCAGYYPSSKRPQTFDESLAEARAQIETVVRAAQEANVKRFVYTSTLSTIGAAPKDRLADEGDVYELGSAPNSAYYDSKIIMENFVLEQARQGFPAVVTNPTAVFGPGDVNLTLGGLLIMAAKGYAKGWIEATTNVVDVRDVGAGHVAAALIGGVGERYILGGHNISMQEALILVAKAANQPEPWLRIPMGAVNALVKISDIFPSLPLPKNHLRTISHWQGLNTTKAETELGFRARPFEETITDALAWFKQAGML